MTMAIQSAEELVVALGSMTTSKALEAITARDDAIRAEERKAAAEMRGEAWISPPPPNPAPPGTRMVCSDGTEFEVPGRAQPAERAKETGDLSIATEDFPLGCCHRCGEPIADQDKGNEGCEDPRCPTLHLRRP
jgi:hypothetical protein